MLTNNSEKTHIKLILSYFQDNSGSGLEYTVHPFSQGTLKTYGERVIHHLNLDHTIRPIPWGDKFRLYVPDTNMSPEGLKNRAKEIADNFRAIYRYHECPGESLEKLILTIIIE